MNKTKFFSSLLVAGLLTASSVFVSCKDYDDDIKALQDAIATNNDAINQLMELKDNGIVITNVQTSGKDVVLTLSDGSTQTIYGGKDGANADVWTIGEDGFWYLNAVKTDYRAVGINGTNGKDGQNGKDGLNGKDGQDGKDGANGVNGLDGLYYVPNQTTGCFDIYSADGTFKESTNIRWKGENDGNGSKVVAVQTAKSVILSGVEGYGDVVIPTAADLKALVFQPKTYYWGIEATTVKTLTMPWYKDLLPLTSYIDKAADRTEVIGTKRPLSPENPIDYQTKDGLAHERYSYGAGTITVTLKANADYHINPSIAWFDNNTSVDVLSDNKTYTRGMGNAIVSFRGNKTGEKHDWTVENGTLSVPLNVNGKVGTVADHVKNSDGSVSYPFSTNPGVTVFAAQVTYKNDQDETVVVTSDYAAIVEETVKDLKIAHVPYNLTTVPYALSETGMLNKHCGRCDLPLYMGSPYYFRERGVHLFQSIDECKDYILKTARKDGNGLGEGWDLVNYQEDIDLNKLVETHYTNTNDAHDVFSGDDFDRNFEYAFELTSVKLGDNATNESAHAAIYLDEATGHYFLHPQDPEVGGLNGRPYDAAKATDVVINRVPVVRVKLIYKGDNKVIDYAYLPIRITKEVKEEERPTVVIDKYSSDKEHAVVRYNDCWTDGGATQDLIVTNWRQTEEDLYSAEGLKQIFDRQTFDNTYRVVLTGGGYGTFGSAINAQQYTVAVDANGKYHFAPVDDPHTPTIADDQFGTINYTEGTVGGHTSSIFTWSVDADDIRNFAVGGVTNVVRAVRLVAIDGIGNPDIYVVFRSGALSLKNYVVKGDANLAEHIIKKYWYASGTTAEGTDEIHANVITPEENDNSKYDLSQNGWKPAEFDDRFSDVFLYNFRTTGGTRYTPNTWIKYNVYENGKLVDGIAPNPPFSYQNYEADFFFADENNGAEFKGYLDNGAAKTFVLRNTQIASSGDKSKKNLYAKVKGAAEADASYQKIASIDMWDGSNGSLRAMEIHLNWGDPTLGDADPGRYAKALLNYKSHNKLADADVLKAKVAIYAVTAERHANPAEDLNNPVVYTTVKCPLALENNTFDVRFLRPIDIDDTNNPEIQDAHAETGVEKQKIYLKDLVTKYKDWRDVKFKYSPNYEQYYAPVNEEYIYATVAGVAIGQNLSANPNVKTTLNGTVEPLIQVTEQLQLVLKEDWDGKYIEYTNNSSNVQDFEIYIPVAVEYYWGTMYDDVILTVKRTLSNAARK